MPLSKDYRFESERLRFRGIEGRDAADIVRWRGDPDNYRNFLDPRPITLEEHLACFEGYLGDPTRFDFIVEDGEGRPIGTCGLSHIGGGGCEASYMIGDAASRGKGYATEALRALTDVAFRELGASHVDARILPHNAASMRVAERCGFTEAERVYRMAAGGNG